MTEKQAKRVVEALNNYLTALLWGNDNNVTTQELEKVVVCRNKLIAALVEEDDDALPRKDDAEAVSP